MTDERLHLGFAEVAAVRTSKAATESLGAGDADPDAVDVDGRRLTFENTHARILEDAPHLVFAVGVVVVVAEHGHDRDRKGAQLLSQGPYLLRSAAARQVTGEQQKVGAVVKVLEAGAEDFRRTSTVVEIANSGDPDHDTGSSLSGSAPETIVVSLTTS